MSQKKAPIGPKRPVHSLPVADLDTTYADAVRDGERDRSHTRRLAEAYRSGAKVPPVVVVTWPAGRWLLADGGYRRLAKLALNSKRIPAEVVECENEAEAVRTATDLACGSNTGPELAMPRSDGDERQTTVFYLTAPHNADASDRQVERACKVHPTIVKRLRLALSHEGTIPAESKAHARHRYDFDNLGGPRRGDVYTPDGRVVHDPKITVAPDHVSSPEPVVYDDDEAGTGTGGGASAEPVDGPASGAVADSANPAADEERTPAVCKNAHAPKPSPRPPDLQVELQLTDADRRRPFLVSLLAAAEAIQSAFRHAVNAPGGADLFERAAAEYGHNIARGEVNKDAMTGRERTLAEPAWAELAAVQAVIRRAVELDATGTDARTAA